MNTTYHIQFSNIMETVAALFVVIFLAHHAFAKGRPPSATILDCTQKNSNGLYARGCSSKFFRCSNGKKYMYTCPNRLKFNVESSKCELKQQVVACLNNVDYEGVMIKADEPFDCAKKKDGVYGTGKCSTTYYHCSRGHSAEMICPAGLYYNDKLKGCDEVDSIDECDVLTALRGYDERRERHLGEKGQYIERNLMYGGMGSVGGKRRMALSKAPQIKTKQGRERGKNRRSRQVVYQIRLKWQPQIVSNCSQLNDGRYGVNKKCSEYYWLCIKNKRLLMICPGGRVFDRFNGNCEDASLVTDCFHTNEDQQNEADHPNLYGDNVLYENTSSREKSRKSSVVQSSEIDEFCRDNGDGFHSVGCLQYYYHCNDGRGYRVNCPNGLYYDELRRICDIKSRISQCSTSMLARKQFSMDEQEKSGEKDDFSSKEDVVSYNENIQDPKYCSQLADGIYVQNCSPEYIICIKQKGRIYKCPQGEVMNETVKTCEKREMVPSCDTMDKI